MKYKKNSKCCGCGKCASYMHLTRPDDDFNFETSIQRFEAVCPYGAIEKIEEKNER
ncbi:MAG: hypothetical protein ABIK92_04580 [Pseudomonadota bacterium]